MRTKECGPKKHAWTVSPRTIHFKSKDGTDESFSYIEDFCLKCSMTKFSGEELQHLFDLAKEGKIRLFQDWFMQAIFEYRKYIAGKDRELRLNSVLMHYLINYIKGKKDQDIGLEYPSFLDENACIKTDGSNFIKGISRVIAFLEECGYITIVPRGFNDKGLKLTAKGYNKVREINKNVMEA